MHFMDIATEQYEDAGSSRDSSLARSEPEQQVGISRKGKNLDRRRESSRYAARDRRGKEADIFMDLKDVVPIVEESTVTHVDRIALLRVASTICRCRRNASKFLQTDLPFEDPEVNVFTEQNLTEALDGFVLLADSDGTILYVSESVSLFLGLTQTDLVGRFLKDFIHNDDYDELVRWSTTDCDVEEASTLDDFGRHLVVRMKTVISPRGRTLNLKSALFKAILCRFRAVTTEYGRLSLIYGSSTPAGQGNSLMLSNSAVKGAEATSGVYMTRHTCDMRFSYVSDSLNYLLRHDSRSLMGSSFYDLVHPSDVSAVAQSFRELFKKSHCRTPFYRLLGANNSVAWAQTEATTVNHTARGQKGQYVLCVHSIVGLQSESESWAEPVVDSINAAHPAICASKIKCEIVDMAEYMGKQPQFVECVDFRPLIDPIADVNFNDYNPVRSTNSRAVLKTRRRGNDQCIDINDSDNAPSAKQLRKKSFDDLFQWLANEEASGPPPPFRDPNSNYSPSEEMFVDNEDPNLAFFNTRESPNENDHSFRDDQFTETRNQAATASVARRAVPYSGASSAISGQYLQQRGNGVRFGTTNVENEAHQQRFSRYDIHRQDQQRRRTPQTIISAQRSVPSRTVSTISKTAGYALPTTGQFHPGRTIGMSPNTVMHSTMSPARNSTTRSRRTSAEPDDTPQFIGEYCRNNYRSRSNSSTASVSSYGNSAARRYSAQNSPAPARKSNTTTIRKSGIQRPLNVNQLNAASPHLQQYQTTNNQMSEDPTNYCRSIKPQNYPQTDIYSNIPTKRAAYGCDEPNDCPQLDKLEDLTNLAPFVPTDDLHQLGEFSWESLCPDFDFSDFYPNDLPCNPAPQINRRPQQIRDDWGYSQY